jgi:hypothetical protein
VGVQAGPLVPLGPAPGSAVELGSAGDAGKALEADDAALLAAIGSIDNIHTVAPSGAAYAVKLSDGLVHDVTLNKASVALTHPSEAEVGAGKARVYALLGRQDSVGGRALAFPANTRFVGNVVPAQSIEKEAVDLYFVQTFDGGATWVVFPSPALGKGGSTDPIAALQTAVAAKLDATALEETISASKVKASSSYGIGLELAKKATPAYVDAPAKLALPYVLKGSLVPQGVITLTANRLYVARIIVERSGKLGNFFAYIGTSSGNCIASVYDTGDGEGATKRKRLWTSGEKATPEQLGFRTIGEKAAVEVTRGQHLDLALSFNNATATLGRGPTASNAAAYKLPAGLIDAAGGAATILWAVVDPGSFTAPPTIEEANLASSTNPPIIGIAVE